VTDLTVALTVYTLIAAFLGAAFYYLNR